MTQLSAVADDGSLKPGKVSLRGRSHVDQYDRNGFYVKAANRYDHTAKRTVECDPDVVAQIDKLIASGELKGTPLDGMGAFIRDAMYHNMERIKRFIADPAQAASLQAAADDYRRIAHADGMVRDMEAKRSIVTGARDGLDSAFSARDNAMVDQLLELYEPMVERMREPYSKQLEEVLTVARDRRRNQ